MDGKNRELTPEEEAAELAKPGDHCPLPAKIDRKKVKKTE